MVRSFREKPGIARGIGADDTRGMSVSSPRGGLSSLEPLARPVYKQTGLFVSVAVTPLAWLPADYAALTGSMLISRTALTRCAGLPRSDFPSTLATLSEPSSSTKNPSQRLTGPFGTATGKVLPGRRRTEARATCRPGARPGNLLVDVVPAVLLPANSAPLIRSSREWNAKTMLPIKRGQGMLAHRAAPARFRAVALPGSMS